MSVVIRLEPPVRVGHQLLHHLGLGQMSRRDVWPLRRLCDRGIVHWTPPGGRNDLPWRLSGRSTAHELHAEKRSFDRSLQLLVTATKLVPEGASSQSHNLKVGLRRVCSDTKFCDKSRDTDDDASTNLGELETNL